MRKVKVACVLDNYLSKKEVRMGAKVKCKKDYNTNDACVEFKKSGDTEVCPVSNAYCCEECEAKKFEYE